MTYKKLVSEPMPDYTKGEEIFNMVTHIVGGGIGVIILISTVIIAALKHINAWGIVGLVIYGISVVALYTVSSIYHGLHASIGKRVFRILDHCTIYFLIAGTYTPICIIAMGWCWQSITILAIEWIGGILGIVLNAIDMNNKIVKVVSMLLYILLGWAIVFIPGAVKLLEPIEFLFILLGGILYMIGVLFYTIGGKKRYSHSIWHIWCDLATISQFIGVLFILLR